MGLVFGVLSVALAPLETHAGEPTVKVIAGIIWFVVAGICFSALRSLAKVGDTGPGRAPRMTGDGTTPCLCSSARWPGRSLSLD